MSHWINTLTKGRGRPVGYKRVYQYPNCLPGTHATDCRSKPWGLSRSEALVFNSEGSAKANAGAMVHDTDYQAVEVILVNGEGAS